MMTSWYQIVKFWTCRDAPCGFFQELGLLLLVLFDLLKALGMAVSFNWSRSKYLHNFFWIGSLWDFQQLRSETCCWPRWWSDPLVLRWCWTFSNFRSWFSLICDHLTFFCLFSFKICQTNISILELKMLQDQRSPESQDPKELKVSYTLHSTHYIYWKMYFKFNTHRTGVWF